MVIRAIVYARGKDEALAQAKSSVFDELVRNQYPFDYYVTFDEKGTTVAGKARWGELPVAVPADSEEGEELIEGGWKATVKEYRRYWSEIQEFVQGEHEPKELWQSSEHWMVRHAMYAFGRYSGPSIFLYTDYGEGIRTREQLDKTLEDHAPGEDDEENVYVVPADVHY